MKTADLEKYMKKITREECTLDWSKSQVFLVCIICCSVHFAPEMPPTSRKVKKNRQPDLPPPRGKNDHHLFLRGLTGTWLGG